VHLRYAAYGGLAFGSPAKLVSRMPKTMGYVKTQACLKDKPYTAFKSENGVKNSLNFGFQHRLM
jgi:hypothetical protein